tara:strand:- start:23 stop:547 length:525 start_codon:yes stop_codon:yes gene_type:complete
VFVELTDWIAASGLRSWVIHMLSNFSFLPPVIQSIHIVSMCVIVGSVGFLSLRLVGIAVPTQSVSEMLHRLSPWFLCALPVSAISGMVFVVARPARYFFNPVVGVKTILFVVGVVLAIFIYIRDRSKNGFWDHKGTNAIVVRLIGCVSIVVWLGVILSGRWIAYVDYLFWPGAA